MLAWAKQHQQRLAGALAGLIAKQELLENLLAWLQWAETTLTEKDKEVIPQEIEEVKTLIAEHQVKKLNAQQLTITSGGYLLSSIASLLQCVPRLVSFLTCHSLSYFNGTLLLGSLVSLQRPRPALDSLFHTCFSSVSSDDQTQPT